MLEQDTQNDPGIENKNDEVDYSPPNEHKYV